MNLQCYQSFIHVIFSPEKLNYMRLSLENVDGAVRPQMMSSEGKESKELGWICKKMIMGGPWALSWVRTEEKTG